MSSRDELTTRQRASFKAMLQGIRVHNRFYREKLGADSLDCHSFEDLPFTSKQELVDDVNAHPPYGSNLSFGADRYTRLHQTSGTTGTPLTILDTAESWASWKHCWAMIYKAVGVVPEDRIYVAFSFGPFVGFWAGFEAGPELGCLTLSGGGQTSVQRLEAIARHQVTVLVCTPSYALYLAEVAREHGFDPARSSIRITLHAGEPGASIPSTKQRIEKTWDARCYDHVGASEVGPYGFECHVQPGGVHINELDYICECIDPRTSRPVKPGEVGELVLTSLNRWGFPVIRYRSGDLVRFAPDGPCSCGRHFRLLEGGVLGRVDDMMTIRGINVFPSAIESVVRRFDQIAEFEVNLFTENELQELLVRVELEPQSDSQSETTLRALAGEFRKDLGIRIEVQKAEPGSLPRFELKAKRFKKLPGPPPGSTV